MYRLNIFCVLTYRIIVPYEGKSERITVTTSKILGSMPYEVWCMYIIASVYLLLYL
jgi:hypothetical protein